MTEEENKFVKKIVNKKSVIIADDPGMGKTTTLTKLCELKYESISVVQSHWVIQINLRDQIQTLKHFELMNDSVSITDVVNLLSRIDLKLNYNFAISLLSAALDKRKNFFKPLLLAIDGFDEILDINDRSKILKLLKFLKDQTAAKIWVTTRLHCKEILENELSTFAFEFDPMDDTVKETYVKKYLQDRLCLILSEEKFDETFIHNSEMNNNERLSKYTEAFLRKMKLVFKGNAFRFLGTPLQLSQLLEGSVTHFKNWIESNENQVPNFSYLGGDMWEIYKTLAEKKYDIYLKKINNKVSHEEDNFFLNTCNKKIAKSLILKPKYECNIGHFKNSALSAGFVKFQGSSVEFIHAPFRDFFAAEVFFDWIIKDPNELLNCNKKEYLLKEILMKRDYERIRTFLNIKLKKNAESEKWKVILKEYGKIAAKLLKEEQSHLVGEEGTVVHIAIKEGNINIACFFLSCLKEQTDALRNFLLWSDRNGETVLQLIFKTDELLLDIAKEISEESLQELQALLRNKNPERISPSI